MFGISKGTLKAFIAIVLFSLIAIFGSAFMLDKYVDSCIARLQPKISNELVVNVYNNTDSGVKVEKGKDGVVNVHVDKGKEVVIDDNKDVSNHMQGVVTAESGLNVRSGADVKSDKVDALEYGEKITVLGENEYWYKIDHGYIYKDYVKILE